MSVFAHPHVSTSVVPQSYSRLELGRNKCESGLSAGLLAFKLKICDFDVVFYCHISAIEEGKLLETLVNPSFVECETGEGERNLYTSRVGFGSLVNLRHWQSHIRNLTVDTPGAQGRYIHHGNICAACPFGVQARVLEICQLSGNAQRCVVIVVASEPISRST